MKNLILLSCLLFVSVIAYAQENLLKGSWKMKEIHWKTADTTYSIHEAEPGIFFFTDKSYAIMWAPSDKPRVPFKVLSKPTDEELMAGFRSVVFNAGSYVYADSTVTATAFIAKVPGFKEGKQFYRYHINWR